MPKPETLYDLKTIQRESFIVHSTVILGASGAISSQTGAKKSGFVVAKTAAKVGRYTVTLVGGTRAEINNALVTILGTTDAAFTDASGIIAAVRNNNIASAGTIEIQMVRNTTLADTEVQDNLTLLITLFISKVA